MRLLFTGGGGAGTEALWSLLSPKYRLHFADAYPERIHPIVDARQRHEVPTATKSTFVPSLRDLAAVIEADLLIPGVDEELVELARHRASFGGTSVVLPEEDFVETMRDKQTCAYWLNGFLQAAPFTENLADGRKNIVDPVIVKPRVGRGSRGVSKIHSSEELISLKASLGDDCKNYVQQEYLAGSEYSVQVVVDQEGSLAAVVPARILRKKGITLEAVIDHQAQIFETCLSIYHEWPSAGIFNVQGKLVPNRGFVPFEINPRISTTFCLAFAAGVDLIELHLEGSRDLRLGKEGVSLRRYWSNVFGKMT